MLWPTSVTWQAPVAARIASIFAADLVGEKLDRGERRPVRQRVERADAARRADRGITGSQTPALQAMPCSSSTGAAAGAGVRLAQQPPAEPHPRIRYPRSPAHFGREERHRAPQPDLLALAGRGVRQIHARPRTSR